jgi:hypothetical protein
MILYRFPVRTRSSARPAILALPILTLSTYACSGYSVWPQINGEWTNHCIDHTEDWQQPQVYAPDQATSLLRRHSTRLPVVFILEMGDIYIDRLLKIVQVLRGSHTEREFFESAVSESIQSYVNNGYIVFI